MKLQAQHIGFDNAVAILNQGIQAIDSGDSVMDMQDVRKTDSAAVAVVLIALAGHQTCPNDRQTRIIARTRFGQLNRVVIGFLQGAGVNSNEKCTE